MVREVLGESFDYLKSVRANSVFCKKLLKFTSKTFASETILFLLMCEKYSKAPNAALFDEIYNEFIANKAPREINIHGEPRRRLVVESNLDIRGTSSVIFQPAIAVAEYDTQAKIQELRIEPFETAFTLTQAAHKQHFDEAMAYLKSHQIHLI